MRRKKQAAYEYWATVMERYEQSGLSQEKFCESEKLSFRRFKYYRYHLAKNEKRCEKSNTTTLTPIHVTADMTSTTSSDIQITLPNKISIKASASCDVVKLNQLIQGLWQCG